MGIYKLVETNRTREDVWDLGLLFPLSNRKEHTDGEYFPLHVTPLTVVTILDHKEQAKNAMLSDFVLCVKDISVF